jgi:two-component system chemotaxis sensor kinase CheA
MQPAPRAAFERTSQHALVVRQLSEAFPDGPPDVPGLAELLAAISETYMAADGERRRLEQMVQRASEQLAERSRRLEEREQRLEQLARLEQIMGEHNTELEQRNRNLTLLLNNVTQGFAAVDLGGKVHAECSQAFTGWFGSPSEVPIWTLLAGDDPNIEAWIQLGFESLSSELMPLEVVLGQLPRRLVRDDRQLQVEYQAIGVPLSMILVVVTDITDELALQRAEAVQRELVAAVDNAYRDRTGFLAFLHETGDMLCGEPHNVPIDELKRHVHTVKGNAALFGITSVADLCHELENHMETHGTAPDAASWGALVDCWQSFYDRIDALLHVSQQRSIIVGWDEYQSMVTAIGNASPALAARIRRWGQDPTRPHLETFADRARQLARRLGKAEIDFEIRDHDVRLDGDGFAPLWLALIHAVRNAVDHGIETTAVRLARGKPPRAHLALSTELHAGELLVEIRDDGAGIGWQAVAERAAAMGMPSATRRDLVDALFANGMSTASQITQTSGRGLGMSALRETCSELGGRVELLSEPGAGTTVRCFVPLPRSGSRTRSTSLFHV